MWGYAANPNMGAVLMVGLGCETFQIGRWKQAYNIAESDTFRSLDHSGLRWHCQKADRGRHCKRCAIMLPACGRRWKA